MKDERQFNKFLSNTMGDLRLMMDNTQILGEPLYINSDEVIVPVIKLTFGFGVGGSEYNVEKDHSGNEILFETGEEFPYGGASLGGMVVSPEAFIHVVKGKVELIRMENNNTLYDKILKLYKEVIKK